MFEVELKFRVDDPTEVIARLQSRNPRREEPVEQVDRYFNHPSRDFRQTDEALRIRSVGSGNFLTYKGPVVDRQTKTRREIETAFAEGPEGAAQLAETLTLLGFRPVREVWKTRTIYRLQLSGRDFEVSVDQVRDLGTFVEIETLASDADRPAARDAVLGVAGDLGLSNPIRESYLAMLLKDREADACNESA